MFTVECIRQDSQKFIFKGTGCWSDVILATGHFKRDFTGFWLSQKFGILGYIRLQNGYKILWKIQVKKIIVKVTGCWSDVTPAPGFKNRKFELFIKLQKKLSWLHFITKWSKWLQHFVKVSCKISKLGVLVWRSLSCVFYYHCNYPKT